MPDTDRLQISRRQRRALESAWLDWAAIDLAERGPDAALLTLAQGSAAMATLDLRVAS